jgi:hypothetical protein
MVYIFSYQKSQIGYILEGLGMKNIGYTYLYLFYGHLEYVFYRNLVDVVAIWYIWRSFGMMYQEKSGNLALARRR